MYVYDSNFLIILILSSLLIIKIILSEISLLYLHKKKIINLVVYIYSFKLLFLLSHNKSLNNYLNTKLNYYAKSLSKIFLYTLKI